MNKQEIENAIEVLRGIYPSQKAIKTGEYDHVADALDDAISALEHQLTNGWIPVSERLPENEERVLICADRKFDDGSVIQIRATAMYEDGTMHTKDSGFCWEEGIDFEYDEETDDYVIPEGWWEQNVYCEEFGKVDDFVTHWQPLPPKYEEGSHE